MIPETRPAAAPVAGEDGAGWVEQRLPVRGWFRRGVLEMRVPANFSPLWSLEMLVWAALAALTLTGIWIGLYYVPTASGAFDSIDAIRRGVQFGWLMLDLHSVAATMLFAVVYVMLYRGLWYGTYRGRREVAWLIEVVRFVLLLAIGFFGFTMIGGPASEAAVRAMAAHLAALPLVGPALRTAYLGGFTATPATAQHLAMAHESLGFLVLLVAALGVAASRVAAPANDHGLYPLDAGDLRPLHPRFTMTVFVTLIGFAVITMLLVGFDPSVGEAPGNVPVTVGPGMLGLSAPAVATPPWYLLGFHGLAMFAGGPGGGAGLTIVLWILLGAMPWLDRGRVASGRFRPVYAGFVFLLGIDWVVLSIAAGSSGGGAWPVVIDLTTIWLFVHFLVVVPLVTAWERTDPVPARLGGRA